MIEARMVTVPGGQVTLSDRRTQTKWTVEVDSFLLAEFPVTRASHERTLTEAAEPARGEREPVVNVSWLDAVRYCNELSRLENLPPAYRLSGDDVEWDRAATGYRLPSEAEWEHACRATTTGPRYGTLDEIAWYRENSGEHVHDVGGKLPNAWGLYDMLGNVWEWCWDVYDAKVYGDYRVLRGGGWCDEHWSCRASVRRRSMPTLQIDDLGFRVARTADA